MLRWLRRIVIALLAVVILVVLFLALTPQGRAAVNTALFITQIVPDIPAMTWFQPEPIRTRVQVPTPEGLREADLYRPPGDGPYAATVLFLGVAPAGPDDERVVSLARGLARANMVTLVYWSPEKLAGQIHPPDTLNLVAAFQYLQDQPFVDAERVGYAGFCVGASFVLMAAAQEEVRDQVAFVNAFGPYYHMLNLATAIGTGTRIYRGERIPWTVDKLTRKVTDKLLLESLESQEEADQVRLAVEQGDTLTPGELSAEGYAVFRVLAGGTLQEVEAILKDLPPRLLERMEEVSPENYVSGIAAPVLIMHDRADTLVPSEESRRLAEALAWRGDVRHTEFSLFQHVNPTRPLPLWEQARELNKLFWHLYAIMRQTT